MDAIPSPSRAGAQPTSPGRWSYSAIPAGIATRALEARCLLAMVRRGPGERVASTVERFELTLRRVAETTGLRVEGKRVLDVGPGQQLRHMRCFALRNAVVGIDTDIAPMTLTLGELRTMLRSNPLLRTVKTVVRKALRFDARFEVALAGALGVDRLPRVRALHMDATRMRFPDATFDFVCSYSAFEHIGDPAAALREVARVLVPGGVAYVSIHLFTSYNGHHDPRMMLGDVLPPWAHLRPSSHDAVRPAAFLNRVRLDGWRELFARVMPGARLIEERRPELAAALAEARAAGELSAYSDDELLTVDLVVIWRKPSRARTSADAAPTGHGAR